MFQYATDLESMDFDFHYLGICFHFNYFNKYHKYVFNTCWKVFGDEKGALTKKSRQPCFRVWLE